MARNFYTPPPGGGCLFKRAREARDRLQLFTVVRSEFKRPAICVMVVCAPALHNWWVLPQSQTITSLDPCGARSCFVVIFQMDSYADIVHGCVSCPPYQSQDDVFEDEVIVSPRVQVNDLRVFHIACEIAKGIKP
jgi:hypothetical protein